MTERGICDRVEKIRGVLGIDSFVLEILLGVVHYAVLNVYLRAVGTSSAEGFLNSFFCVDSESIK